jgi:hypothetical protein
MSVPPLSKIVRFLLIAAGLIIVLSVLWNYVDSGYSRFLSNIAAGVVNDEYRVKEIDGTITFTQKYALDTAGKPTNILMPENTPAEDGIVASAIQFGLLLTIALVAATPGLTWRRRILFSAGAAAVTFILQILSVVVMAKTLNSLLFVIVSDVFPPLLWAIFSFRYWLYPQPAPAPQTILQAVPKKSRK